MLAKGRMQRTSCLQLQTFGIRSSTPFFLVNQFMNANFLSKSISAYITKTHMSNPATYSLEACLDSMVPVNQGHYGMMIGEGNEIQFRKSTGCLECVDSCGVGCIPSWCIYVVVLGQIVQILN